LRYSHFMLTAVKSQTTTRRRSSRRRFCLRGDRSIQYTANEQAYQITQGKYVTQFWYAPNNQRYKRIDIVTATNGSIDPPPPTTTSFAVSAPLSLFRASGLAAPVAAAAAPPATPLLTKTITIANLEVITAPNGVVTKRRTVAGVMLQETVGNVSVNRYVFHNHLGSVMRIAETDGNVTWSFDYSPFGERRMPTAYNPNGIGYASAITRRGYTGHEMLDAFSIVHMNGRIYDCVLGRFLQADPMIQDPSNGQNFNRYTYVWNNPLAYTDPSGFMSFRSLTRAVGGVFIASYLPGASFWGGAANGALANISAGFIGGYIATGNLRGGLAGAFSNGVMYAANNRAPLQEAVTPDATDTEQTGGKYASATASGDSYSFNGRDSLGKSTQDLSAVPNDKFRKLMMSKNPADREAAAKAAAKYFGIFDLDITYTYDPALKDGGKMFAGGQLKLGDKAFSSWSNLGSALGHEIEVHHQRQWILGDGPADDQTRWINEVEGYDYNLDPKNVKRFGNTASEVKTFQYWRDTYYGGLTPRNKLQVDRGIYDLPNSK
jgi:RHS repeat-associated protein